MQNRSLNSQSRAFFLRFFLPPLFFFLALCLLVVTFHNYGYSALPPTTKRYTEAKEELAKLSKDNTRNRYRDVWENLIKEFLTIYDADPLWPNRPAALFRAAEAAEELAKHSFSPQDAKRAAQYYEKITQLHAKNPLADDALYRAAKIHAAWLRDDKTALTYLAKIKSDYPSGDMTTDAEALEKTIRASEKGRLAPEAKSVVRAEKRAIDDPLVLNTPTAQEKMSRKFTQAKARMQELAQDSNRSCWRQPWENLETEFLQIHKEAKTLAIASGALYRAAQSRAALANCSQSRKDYQRAVELFLSLPDCFPSSNLADDALFLAAQIQTQKLGQEREGQKTLAQLLRRFPKADKAPEARNLLRKMATPSKNVLPGPVELQLLSWDSLDKNRVKITLELSGKTQYRAKLVDGPKDGGKHLYLELNGTAIAQNIKKGAIIRGSLLHRISCETGAKNQARLRFDLRAAKRFDITQEQKTNTIILTVDARKNVRPMDITKGENIVSSEPIAKSAPLANSGPSKEAKKAPTRQVNDMARQLGLSVQTIFIDAGHGGKDPGTYHNNIVERLVTLDVARTLGRLLENNGFTVVYSRTTDTFISLSQRTHMANAARADIFVSIHVNASDRSEAEGFETYYLDFSRNPDAARVAALENAGSDRRLGDMQKMLADIMLTARVDESSRLARDIQRVVLSRLKKNGQPAKNNGIKSAPFHVLIGAQMPAVLVELGYCSNTKEAKKLATARYRELLAEGLAEGIMAYRDRLAQKRTVENSLTLGQQNAI